MEEELRKKYENNEYMLQKLNDYLKHLPILMETLEKEYIQKCERKKQLCQQKEEFIESFMNTNALFYISSTEQYIEKKQNEFIFIKEDDVVYRIGTVSYTHLTLPTILRV